MLVEDMAAADLDEDADVNMMGCELLGVATAVPA